MFAQFFQFSSANPLTTRRRTVCDHLESYFASPCCRSTARPIPGCGGLSISSSSKVSPSSQSRFGVDVSAIAGVDEGAAPPPGKFFEPAEVGIAVVAAGHEDRREKLGPVRRRGKKTAIVTPLLPQALPMVGARIVELRHNQDERRSVICHGRPPQSARFPTPPHDAPGPGSPRCPAARCESAIHYLR